MIQYLLLIIVKLHFIKATDIVDYTRENYVLVERFEVALYNDFGNIFHLTNLTFYENILTETRNLIDAKKYISFEIPNTNVKHNYSSYKELSPYDDNIFEIKFELEIIDTLLEQLDKIDKYKTKTKRGINELGTIWKWIAGTPDHDDFVLIKNKLNELTENNNKQFVTNSKLFKAITEITETVNNLKGSSRIVKFLKQRNNLIINELHNLIQTIALAKANILNPAILNLKEIKEVISHEHKDLTLTDLLDVSQFKIIQTKDVIAIYIKYPIIQKLCKIYETRAINQYDGKLLLEKQIAYCNNTYVSIQNCKTEIKNTFCKIGNNNTCLVDILNKQNGKCKKIKEQNLDLEIITEGAILISGKHIVDGHKVNGTYLIIFDNYTKIDNITFENPTTKITNYLKTVSIDEFLITEYIESKDIELNLNNISLMSKYNDESSINIVIWISIILFLFIVISIIYIKIKVYIKKRRSEQNEKMFLELSKKINEEM